MKNFTPFLICFCLLLFAEDSEAQVTKLSNNTNFQLAVTLGNKAILVNNNDSIWVTNGTPAGTKKLTNKVAFKDQVAIYQNKIFFAGETAKGIELWATDCTAAGTVLIKDIYPGAQSSSPTSFFVFNNILFFYARTAAKGNELWKSDGTAEGTKLLKDIWVGSGNSNTTAAPTFFYPVGNKLYFQANDSTNGAELWKTNGTPAGTALVKNLSTGKNSLKIDTYHSLNNKLVFIGKDAEVTGIKLWQTDGTSGGTTLIKKLLPTSDNTSGLSAFSLSNFKNKLVFYLQGFSFSPIPTFVNQLYVTDGTGTNTILLKDFQDKIFIPGFTLTPTIKNKFYFTTLSDSAILWESNATAAGTKITKVIDNAVGGSSENFPLILTNLYASHPDSVATSDFKGKFFMIADNGTKGYEPWITNGTAAGTTMIKDIYTNTGSSIDIEYFSFVYSKKGLYFSANDNVKGNELWFSDGTSAGTNMVADIRLGATGSNPLFIGILNNRLLFTAKDDGNARVDLYKVDAVFDTLSFAKTEAVKAIIAPDGTQFSIYPNPAKDQLNVNLNKSFNSEKISLAITNQQGRQVYENTISGMQFSSTYKIDISDLAQGTYYLEVRTDKGVVSTKFIKIR